MREREWVSEGERKKKEGRVSEGEREWTRTLTFYDTGLWPWCDSNSNKHTFYVLSPSLFFFYLSSSSSFFLLLFSLSLSISYFYSLSSYFHSLSPIFCRNVQMDYAMNTHSNYYFQTTFQLEVSFFFFLSFLIFLSLSILLSQLCSFLPVKIVLSLFLYFFLFSSFLRQMHQVTLITFFQPGNTWINEMWSTLKWVLSSFIFFFLSSSLSFCSFSFSSFFTLSFVFPCLPYVTLQSSHSFFLSLSLSLSLSLLLFIFWFFQSSLPFPVGKFRTQMKALPIRDIIFLLSFIYYSTFRAFFLHEKLCEKERRRRNIYI